MTNTVKAFVRTVTKTQTHDVMAPHALKATRMLFAFHTIGTEVERTKLTAHSGSGAHLTLHIYETTQKLSTKNGST